jgi:hypothetical protein
MRRGDRRHGPAGATAARCAHERGLVGDHARKGPQPLCSHSTRRSRRSVTVANDEIKFFRRTSSARSVPRTAHVSPRRRRRRPAVLGRGQQPPSTVGGGGFHADASSALRAVDFKARSSSGPSTGADVVDWPSTTTRWSRTTPRPSAWSASPARGRRTRSPNGARALPDAARRRHVRRDAHDRSCDAASAITRTPRRPA